MSTLAGATGVLSGTFILQACDRANSAEELNQMLETSISTVSNAEGTPIGLPLSIQDQEYIKFLNRLSTEIVDNPQIAREFGSNPEAFCYKYGYTNQMNLNQGLVKLIMALGDTEINDSVKNGDINTFIKACKKEGLLELESLNYDPYLNRLSEYVTKEYNHPSSLAKCINITRTETNQQQETVDNFSAIYGAVAIVIAAVAVEAFVVIGTTTWVTHVHQHTHHDLDNNRMLEVWELKNGQTDYVASNEINNAIVEEGMGIIKNNFPEVYNNVDEDVLKSVILLNVSKNMPYEE